MGHYKPFFIADADDDAATIVRQITERVGADHFGFAGLIESVEDLED